MASSPLLVQPQTFKRNILLTNISDPHFSNYSRLGLFSNPRVEYKKQGKKQQLQNRSHILNTKISQDGVHCCWSNQRGWSMGESSYLQDAAQALTKLGGKNGVYGHKCIQISCQGNMEIVLCNDVKSTPPPTPPLVLPLETLEVVTNILKERLLHQSRCRVLGHLRFGHFE